MPRITKKHQQDLKKAIIDEFDKFKTQNEKDPKTYERFPTIKYLADKLKKDKDTISKYILEIASDEEKLLEENFSFERLDVIKKGIKLHYKHLNNCENSMNSSDEKIKLDAGSEAIKTIESLAHLIYSSSIFLKSTKLSDNNEFNTTKEFSNRQENRTTESTVKH
jgi:hypothetical protein